MDNRSRIKRWLVGGTIAATLVLGLAACGDDEGSFEKTDAPELTVEGVQQGFNLNPPTSSNRPQSQTPISLRNQGEGRLEVTRLELVDAPARLIPIRSTTDTTCEWDINAANYDATGACTGDQICWPLASRCRDTGLFDTPFEIEPSLQRQVELAVMPGESGMDCPEPGTNIPSDFRDAYCGHLVIETNARNSSGLVDEGKAVIYFQYVAGSGAISVEPTDIKFVGVAPGEPMSREFTITNVGDDPLQVVSAEVEEYSDLLEVTGDQSLPTTIEAGTAATWSLTLTPPAEWLQDQPCADDAACGRGFSCDIPDGQAEGTCDLAIADFLIITSSDPDDREKAIAVTATTGSDRPVMTVEPTTLGFSDAAEKTFTITNDGTAAAVLQSVSVSPQARDYYRFEYKGPTDSVFNAVSGNLSSLLGVGDTGTFKVLFDSAAGDDLGIGIAEISYSYFVGDERISNRMEVTLLGGAGDAAVGMVYPEAFTYRAAQDNEQTRSFVIRNVGSQDLTISDATFEQQGLGTPEDFSVQNATGTVAPGALKEVTVTYSASDNETDNIRLVLTSDSATDDPAVDGDELAVQLYADQTAPQIDLSAALVPSFSDDTTAVGAAAGFSARSSTVSSPDILDAAQWFLLARPDGSDAWIKSSGPDVSFVPDVAGTYKISVLLNDQSVASQATYVFTAE